MSTARGFTLIEVMIVVLIVSILAAIAVPSYNDYITRSKITEATANLAGLRVKMEQFYQDNRTFANGPCTTSGKYFSYSCVAATSTAYTIQALGGTSGDSTMTGFTYTVDQDNNKTSTITKSGWTGNATCWAIRKDGSC